MIRCLAIDDEPLALQQLVAYISKMPFLELAAQCQSALEARAFLEHDTVDAIFCDINMPDLNGMDFVKSLVVPPLIVFTTAYSEYAVEGFRVNAVDYLLKPFGLQEFQRTANRVRERFEMKGNVSAFGPVTSTPNIVWKLNRLAELARFTSLPVTSICLSLGKSITKPSEDSCACRFW